MHLNIWGDWGPVVIRLCQGASPVISTVRLGSVLPLTRSATGLVYLAFAPSALTQPLLEREMTTQYHPIDRDDLNKRIELTREQGFGAVDGLLIPGLVAICAPVFDFRRDLACAISVTGTDPAISAPNCPCAQRLLEICLDITTSCGGR
ncbi:putative HTH-type transcriptional regulator RhmR [compost metagenome]